jgi:hypothetical protein
LRRRKRRYQDNKGNRQNNAWHRIPHHYNLAVHRPNSLARFKGE